MIGAKQPHSLIGGWLGSMWATLVGFALCLYQLSLNLPSVLAGGGDTGWLVRTGQLICECGSLPQHDIFTWTNCASFLPCYQWLFSVCSYLLFRVGGLWLVGLVTYLAVALLYLYYLPRFWSRLGLAPGLAYLFLLPALTSFWMFARPQLITNLAAFFCIAILEHWRSKPQTRMIFLLPLITLLWTNMHCFAALGVALTALYLLQAALAKANLKRISLAFAFTTLAACVTPFDWQTLQASFDIFVHTDLKACNELRPLYLTSLLFDVANLYTLAALSLIAWQWKKIPWSGLLIAGASLIGGLLVARLQPLAVILSWPFVGLALAAAIPAQFAVQTLSAPSAMIERKNLLWLSAVQICAAVIWLSNYPNQAAAENAYLARAPVLKFAHEHLGGNTRLFNDTISGARLIYLGGPAVFIDSRLFLFKADFYQNWLDVMNGVQAWQPFAKRDGINAVVISHGYQLSETLMESSEWLLVADDGGSALWLKNCPDSIDWLKQLKVDPDQPLSLGFGGEALAIDSVSMAAKHFRTARTYFKGGDYNLAELEINKSLRVLQTQRAKNLQQQILEQSVKSLRP